MTPRPTNAPQSYLWKTDRSQLPLKPYRFHYLLGFAFVGTYPVLYVAVLMPSSFLARQVLRVPYPAAFSSLSLGLKAVLRGLCVFFWRCIFLEVGCYQPCFIPVFGAVGTRLTVAPDRVQTGTVRWGFLSSSPGSSTSLSLERTV